MNQTTFLTVTNWYFRDICWLFLSCCSFWNLWLCFHENQNFLAPFQQSRIEWGHFLKKSCIVCVEYQITWPLEVWISCSFYHLKGLHLHFPKLLAERISMSDVFKHCRSVSDLVTYVFSFHRNAPTFKSFEEKMGTLKVTEQKQD